MIGLPPKAEDKIPGQAAQAQPANGTWPQQSGDQHQQNHDQHPLEHLCPRSKNRIRPVPTGRGKQGASLPPENPIDGHLMTKRPHADYATAFPVPAPTPGARRGGVR